MGISTAMYIFLANWLVVPLIYVLNKTEAMKDERLIFVAGVLVLSACGLVTRVFVRKSNRKHDPLFYVWSIFAFTSCIDIFIALELDGYVSKFMTFYLKEGEPYLMTSYGTMINWWDGTAHYAMYIILLALYCSGRSYKDLGLYWAGSIGNSMLVFLPGNITGKFGIKWSYMLNIPYLFFPFWSAARFLYQSQKNPRNREMKSGIKSIWTRPVDIVLVAYLTLSAVLACGRAMVVLGCTDNWAKTYLTEYEPYLMDQNQYPKMQMLVYFFYFVPFYLAAIYGLIWPGQSWLPGWSLFHAGASAQAQFVHIGCSFHHRTSSQLHLPSNPDVRLVFWLLNFVCLMVGPHLLAIRCNTFHKSISDEEQKHSPVHGISPSSRNKKRN